MRKDSVQIDAGLAMFRCFHCFLIPLVSKLYVVRTRPGGTNMCCCTLARSCDFFRFMVLKKGKGTCCMTHYLRADLDVELPSSLPSELLLASKFKQGCCCLDMGFPMMVAIPSLKIDGLYACQYIELVNNTQDGEITSNSPSRMTARNVVSAIA